MDDETKWVKSNINLQKDQAAIEEFILSSLSEFLGDKTSPQILQFELDAPTGELYIFAGTRDAPVEVNSLHIESWENFYTRQYKGESVIRLRDDLGKLKTLEGVNEATFQEYFMQFIARTVRGKSEEILNILGLGQVNISITAYEENVPPVEFEIKKERSS